MSSTAQPPASLFLPRSPNSTQKETAKTAFFRVTCAYDEPLQEEVGSPFSRGAWPEAWRASVTCSKSLDWPGTQLTVPLEDFRSWGSGLDPSYEWLQCPQGSADSREPGSHWPVATLSLAQLSSARREAQCLLSWWSSDPVWLVQALSFLVANFCKRPLFTIKVRSVCL